MVLVGLCKVLIYARLCVSSFIFFLLIILKTEDESLYQTYAVENYQEISCFSLRLDSFEIRTYIHTFHIQLESAHSQKHSYSWPLTTLFVVSELTVKYFGTYWPPIGQEPTLRWQFGATGIWGRLVVFSSLCCFWNFLTLCVEDSSGWKLGQLLSYVTKRKKHWLEGSEWVLPTPP